MADEAKVKALKERVSPRLRSIPGVSGVGTAGGMLTIYLKEDSANLRKRVSDVVAEENPSAPISFQITGEFTRFDNAGRTSAPSTKGNATGGSGPDDER